MSVLTTLLLALSLAFDAFAVSVSCGVSAKRTRVSNPFMIAGFFGAFQSGMPLAGWAVGSVLEPVVASVDHWIAFVLLCSIGIHMIYEAARPEGKQHFRDVDLRILLLLSVATSIDALIAGFSFAFIQVEIIRTVVMIGLVTFLLSYIGYNIGDNLGHFFRDKVRFLGGLILIGIGVKILVEHLT